MPIDGTKFLNKNKEFITGIKTRNKIIFDENGDFNKIRDEDKKVEEKPKKLKDAFEEAKKEEKIIKKKASNKIPKKSNRTKKCPECGELINNNWEFCQDCKKKNYQQVFEEKVKPLFEDADQVLTSDIKEATGEDHDFIYGFLQWLVNENLLQVSQKKGNRNWYKIPGKEIIEKTYCKFCGVRVRRNNLVCSKCRPRWIKEIFEEIYPTLEDGEYHKCMELWSIIGYSQITAYRLLKQMEKKGWVKSRSRNGEKSYKLRQYQEKKEDGKSNLYFGKVEEAKKILKQGKRGEFDIIDDPFKNAIELPENSSISIIITQETGRTTIQINTG